MLMKKAYTEDSTKGFIKELKKISPKIAKKFFLIHGYRSSSFEMPEYYIAGSLDKIKLKPIDWNSEKPKITRPLEFLTPKGFLGWRSFSLLHPYIYIHIVEEITRPEFWKKVVEILTSQSLVRSYSTPGFITTNDSVTKKQAIDRWVLMAEKDLIKDSIGFSFLTVTDIKNFYPSIYTHSIAWALEGRDTI